MAAETFKGQLRTGFIGALFTLAVLFIFGIVTNLGGRIFNAADKGYVDEQDAEIRTEIVSGDSALKNDIKELEQEVESDMGKLLDNMNARFDEQNHTLNIVVELLKE